MQARQTAKVLLIEDCPETTLVVTTKLSQAGYEVHTAADGALGLVAARREQPDLVILDRMLPGMDGLDVCRRLRQAGDTPILMLTARGEVDDRIEGLQTGANDYLPKPFHLGELTARVDALLRARRPAATTRLRFADLTLDEATHEAWCGDEPIHLTRREFAILAALLRRPTQPIAREWLLTNVWGYDFDGEDNVLDVYIRRLRKKLEGSECRIATVRGVGYALRDAPLGHADGATADP